MAAVGPIIAWLLQALAVQNTRRDVSFADELGSHLSPKASILLPGSKQFNEATTRWTPYKEPNITMVVEVATEKDVQVTINYANRHDIPFLAVNGGHGAINSLDTVHHGIQIWMRKLNSIDVSKDGTTALMGGGVVSKEITDTLWAQGKQTVTGACECTGMLGPMLGGGHGWLQGRYGLSADNLLEARMVLANGSAIDVSSEKNPDLFWAIRGAGHNFGIVTKFKYKIYDVPPKNTWTVESLVFAADKVEEVYELTNKITGDGKQPVEFITFSYFIRIPTIDPDNAVINYLIIYEGTLSEESKTGRQFQDIGPLNVTTNVVEYPEIPGLTGLSNADPGCQRGFTALRFPISLQRHNVSALRTVYDMFNDITAAEPALGYSLILFEGYSLEGVKAVPEASTAFPDRFNNVLILIAFFYPADKKLDHIATKAGKKIRNFIRESSGLSDLHAYVNYAHGDETLEEMYGHEPWRVRRLKALKKEYDPHEKFSFYAPIR